jgi:hypothetical protein
MEKTEILEKGTKKCNKFIFKCDDKAWISIVLAVWIAMRWNDGFVSALKTFGYETLILGRELSPKAFITRAKIRQIQIFNAILSTGSKEVAIRTGIIDQMYSE